LFSLVLTVCFTFIFRKKSFVNDLKYFKKLSKSDQQKGISLTLIAGILLGLNWFLFIYVVNRVNVQSASFAYLICPIITAFLASILLKEKLQKLQWISIIISFIGCSICFLNNSNNLFFALIVALTYALYLISQRSNIYFDKLNNLVFQILIICILSLSHYFIKGFTVPQNLSFYGYIFAI